MSLFAIIGIISLGLAIIAVEIVFVPGTTVVGLLGFIVVLTGLYFVFDQYGATIGWSTSFAITIIVGLSFYWAIQKKVWKRYSLQSEISGKVDSNPVENIQLSQEGVSISALRPSGMAEFENVRIEVSTSGMFVDAGVRVKVIAINKGRITVEAV